MLLLLPLTVVAIVAVFVDDVVAVVAVAVFVDDVVAVVAVDAVAVVLIIGVGDGDW